MALNRRLLFDHFCTKCKNIPSIQWNEGFGCTYFCSIHGTEFIKSYYDMDETEKNDVAPKVIYTNLAYSD